MLFSLLPTLRYNHYVTEWNEKYYEPFLNTIFSYKMDNQTGTFLVVATGKESFEFVKDKCDRPSDPAEGCVNATGVFHLATVKLTGTSTITLSAHGKEVLSYELPYASTKTLSVFDLDCHYERYCLWILLISVVVVVQVLVSREAVSGAATSALCPPTSIPFR